MKLKLNGQIAVALGCALVIVLLFVDSSAQQGRRRRRPSRRVTHPVAPPRASVTPAQTDAPEIISTEDVSANGSDSNVFV